MTIYKRIVSFLLSLLLVFSMFGSTFAIQTFAATSPALSTEGKTVKAGEQFTVAVSLANATTVYGGNFTLQYDSSLLTADLYEFSSIVSGHTKNCNLNYQSAGNLIRVTFSGASAVTSSGILITFTFTAKENVSGSASLQFNAYKMYDENGSAITSTANGSTITIATEPVVSPTLSITNKTITEGSTVNVPIVISNSEAVYGGNFTLQYDSDLLTADSYSFGSIVSGHTKNCNLDYQSAGNLIRVTFSGADAVSSDGTLVTFTFTAKASGTATLQFNAYKMYDENGTSVDTTVSDGNVTINPIPDIDATKTYTGLYKVDGVWRYVKNGELSDTYKGLVKYGGKWYYVVDGEVNFSYTGLAKRAGKWYYVKKGVVDFSYTGLCKYSGKWYYVNKGSVDFTYTGLVKYAGKWYYVEDGIKDATYTGLVKYSGKWYYVKKGALASTYTGLVKHTDGKWYYVKKGVKTTYTGNVKYNGKTYKVKNGVKI